MNRNRRFAFIALYFCRVRFFLHKCYMRLCVSTLGTCAHLMKAYQDRIHNRAALLKAKTAEFATRTDVFLRAVQDDPAAFGNTDTLRQMQTALLAESESLKRQMVRIQSSNLRAAPQA